MLREPQSGQPVSADWGREIVKAVRERTIVSGEGIRATQSPGGTVVSIVPQYHRVPRASADAEFLFPFKLQIKHPPGYDEQNTWNYQLQMFAPDAGEAQFIAYQAAEPNHGNADNPGNIYRFALKLDSSVPRSGDWADLPVRSILDTGTVYAWMEGGAIKAGYNVTMGNDEFPVISVGLYDTIGRRIIQHQFGTAYFNYFVGMRVVNYGL